MNRFHQLMMDIIKTENKTEESTAAVTEEQAPSQENNAAATAAASDEMVHINQDTIQQINDVDVEPQEDAKQQAPGTNTDDTDEKNTEKQENVVIIDPPQQATADENGGTEQQAGAAVEDGRTIGEEKIETKSELQQDDTSEMISALEKLRMDHGASNHVIVSDVKPPYSEGQHSATVEKSVSVGSQALRFSENQEVSSSTGAKVEHTKTSRAGRRGSYQSSRSYAGSFQNYGLTYLPYKSNFEPSEEARRRADEFFKTLKL